LKGYGNDILLEASCLLISSSISQEALELRPDIGVKLVPRWRFILDISLRHRNDTVQEAAARTVGAVSHLRSSEDDTDR
jgi:tubulin-specific chaperone D